MKIEGGETFTIYDEQDRYKFKTFEANSIPGGCRIRSSGTASGAADPTLRERRRSTKTPSPTSAPRNGVSSTRTTIRWTSPTTSGKPNSAFSSASTPRSPISGSTDPGRVAYRKTGNPGLRGAGRTNRRQAQALLLRTVLDGFTNGAQVLPHCSMSSWSATRAPMSSRLVSIRLSPRSDPARRLLWYNQISLLP